MFYFWVKIIKNFQRPTRGKFFIGFLWFITINSLIFIDIDDKLKCDKNETNSGVCAGMCRSMQVCVAVHGYMQVWVGVRGCVRVYMCAWGHARMCAGACWCVWDKFSEYLLENWVLTSGDLNRYPIRIFLNRL